MHYTVWAENTALRDSVGPDGTSHVLATFSQGDEVTPLGKRSHARSQATLHGVPFDDDWIYVQRRYLTDERGWIYQGALRPSISVDDRFMNATADESGRYLTIGMYAPEAFPKETITTALCPNGKTVAIRYMAPDSAEVAIYSSRIRHLPGGEGLYKTSAKTADVGHTCFLVDTRFLADRNILLYTKTPRDPLPQSLTSRIEDEKHRAIDQSWHKASITDVGDLYFVLFHPDGRNALASLILIKHDGKIVYQDYPGHLDPANDYPSVWRVDDGGAIGPLDFQVVNYFQTKDGLEMLILWTGPEGVNITLVREAGNTFYPIYHDYIIAAH